MKKRILSIVALVLACLMLVACGGTDAKESTAPESTAPESTAPESTGDTDYPNRPITVVIPAGAGGDTDINTRIFTKYLGEELGQTIVISNISGISVALPEIKDAEPDGYTLGSYHAGIITSTLLGTIDYGYQDFEFFNIFANDTQSAWFVAADAPYQTLDELAAAAKEAPVSFATEVGSISHLTGFNFQTIAEGAQINVVDAGGGAEKITALLSGQLDIMYNQVGLCSDYLESGEFRCLGVMSDERSEANPDIPTFKEQGYDMNFDKPYWLFGPKGMDPAVIETINTAIDNVQANPDYAAELQEIMQTVPGGMSSADALAVVDGINAQYTELMNSYLESVA